MGGAAVSAVDWAAEFSNFPPAFHRLLADLLAEIEAERAREQGVKLAGGRRAQQPSGSMQDVVDVVYPRRSQKPFREALAEATDQPPATVAALAGMNPGTMFRLRNGRRPLTKDTLEQIARAIHVDPGYFHEYRVLVVHEAIDALLTPLRSLQAYSSVERDHRRNPRPKTPNAPNGFSTTARGVLAYPTKQGREAAE